MTTSFALRPDEQIVFQTHRKRAWYNILGTILFTGFFVIVFAFGAGMMHLNSFYPSLMILLVLFGGTSDLISMLISEVTLTDRRILVKGVPNPWTRLDLPLDEVESLNPAWGGIRIKQKRRLLSRAVSVPDKRKFMEAYQQIAGK